MRLYGCLNVTFQQYFSYILTFELPFMARIWCKVEIHQGIYVPGHSTHRKESTLTITHPGLDINVCPIPVKTDVGQVDLVLRLSDGTSEKIRDSQTCRYDGKIYFHWYKILGLLYHLSFLHMKFKDIDKIKVAISETL